LRDNGSSAQCNADRVELRGEQDRKDTVAEARPAIISSGATCSLSRKS